MFEFLHIVLYIPKPKITAAKTDSGIKMKILVLRPMQNMKHFDIKLSQFSQHQFEECPWFWDFVTAGSCIGESDLMHCHN